ncbi:PilZ domain-containing protein [Clostridium guangxiense]|uniref:PilZ domain-containing protein n=1 Tax=Clostridium guangxiense TaxID=1662055 RepID=UPI001E398896|nr:PilZ domain-containing protein [Clostridium guangxiense]MCD2348586.1 PilZ domain-containing protein [Clostridium guangxiense]
MKNFTEQRNFKRVRFKCLATFFMVNGIDKINDVEILDISESGTRLNLPKRLQIGDKITFKFPIGNLNLTCNATIIWGQVGMEKGFIYGCKFDLLATNKHLLKRIIEEFYRNNFIYIYKDKATKIIENMTCTISISASDIDTLFQYSSWLLGEVDKSNRLAFIILKNLVNRFEEYGNNHLNYFNISIYEYEEFKHVLDFSISSLYGDNLNIKALKLENIDISPLESQKASNLRHKFDALPDDIKLDVAKEISKYLFNIENK